MLFTFMKNKNYKIHKKIDDSGIGSSSYSPAALWGWDEEDRV